MINIAFEFIILRRVLSTMTTFERNPIRRSDLTRPTARRIDLQTFRRFNGDITRHLSIRLEESSSIGQRFGLGSSDLDYEDCHIEVL